MGRACRDLRGRRELSDEQVRATVHGEADAPCWSAAEQALIAAVDALHHRATLSDAEFAALSAHYDDDADPGDHHALRLLPHGIVSGERAGAAAGGERRRGFRTSRNMSASRCDSHARPQQIVQVEDPDRLVCVVTISVVIFAELSSSSASLASESRSITLGLRVMTSSTMSSVRSGRIWRRRSPSVMMPTMRPWHRRWRRSQSPWPTSPPARPTSWCQPASAARASPVCIDPDVCLSIAPSLPPGWNFANSSAVKPRLFKQRDGERIADRGLHQGRGGRREIMRAGLAHLRQLQHDPRRLRPARIPHSTSPRSSGSQSAPSN